MDNRPHRKGKLKIGVFGPYHAGKSSFIQSIDPSARHTEARTPGGDHTTVAIDFGRTIINGTPIYLFGTPGQERFEFVRGLITRGLDGALLLVDATIGLHTMHERIRHHLQERGVPMAYLINTFEASPDPEAIRSALKGEVFHEISALDPVTSRKALESFVQRILLS
jgi:signal recognition particle receptor subunit beta